MPLKYLFNQQINVVTTPLESVKGGDNDDDDFFINDYVCQNTMLETYQFIGFFH